METRKYGSFSSSENPQELAKTVEGIIVGLSSIIIFIASLKGISVGQDQVLAFAQQAGVTVGAFGTAIGGVIFLFGVIRKIIVKLTQTVPTA
jgi:hypothetical protein